VLSADLKIEINFENFQDYDGGSPHQLCVDGCSGSTIPLAEALRSPIEYSKCIWQTMTLRTPKELAIGIFSFKKAFKHAKKVDPDSGKAVYLLKRKCKNSNLRKCKIRKPAV
jgi:hypothetical protein